MEKILVTGAAGFIGFHTVKKLVSEGYEVVGVDSINDYYSPLLKKARLKECGVNKTSVNMDAIPSSIFCNYRFIEMDLANREDTALLFSEHRFDRVINLAAQPSVRYSIKKPYNYIDSNINGFITVLEGCRHTGVKHLVYASSSSVYGNSEEPTFSENDNVDHPISLYAATKKAGELMAYTYSHLYNLPVTGLRFFTVYGPWGRPDMAYYKFTKSILEDEPIDVYNNGNLLRDFTYVDDIVDGIRNLVFKVPEKSPSYDIYNIGNANPVKLMDFISTLEDQLDKKAIINFKPMQDGDVYKTFANTSKLENFTGFKPKTSLKEGLSVFVDWYKDFYKL
jgi:UDP-glucuronate 4-epimerase